MLNLIDPNSGDIHIGAFPPCGLDVSISFYTGFNRVLSNLLDVQYVSRSQFLTRLLKSSY